jgi:hypothetical protein
MAERHSDNDGSDIFWPGYVDAVTNLVLNLLFLLTIMIVAVFMFALELGRASSGGPGKTTVVSTIEDAKVASKKTIDPAKENIELKLEIQRLTMQLAQQSSQKGQSRLPGKTVDVTSSPAKPVNGLDKAVAASDSDILVRFMDDAVAFTPAELERLRETLKPVMSNEKTTILVEVPAGFTEARRMGYYRAMAVRNVLLEMKVPNDRIDVSVREGKTGANASLVRVRSR